MNQRITTAVFPVAGLGTRFLPATKASPKEMLPIVDKPLIQYAAEEAVRAGIKRLVFITGRNKRAIPDHFDKANELERVLADKGKTALVEAVRSVLPRDVTCVYVRQHEPLGLGHAVLCAKPLVANEPFAVVLPDDLIYTGDSANCIEQMTSLYERHGSSVVAVQQVRPDHTDRYGIVVPQWRGERTTRITGIVEKPKPEKAPSTLGVVGRYLLTPRIFDYLEQIPTGAGGEIQLTDAIAALLKEEAVLAHQFTGKRYDCGSKIGYLEATVEYGLRHAEVGDAFSEYMSAGGWQTALSAPASASRSGVAAAAGGAG